MSKTTTIRKAGLAICAAFALSLSACSGGGSDASPSGEAAPGDSGNSGETVQLTMAINQGADSAARRVVQELIDEFQTENPNITIEMLPASNQYESDMKVKMGANDLPDIFSTHGWSVKRYGPFLAPLTDEEWASRVNPLLDSSMRDEAGDLFAFPSETDLYGLTYNETVLKDAGVDPFSIKTWDDFDAACEKIVAKGDASCIYAGAKNVYYPGNFANTIAPGVYTDAELKSLQEGTFPDEPWAKISDMISSWASKGFFNPDYVSASDDDMAKALANGNTGFVFAQASTAADAMSYNPDAPIKYIPVPAESGEPYAIGGEGLTALGVAKTGHVEEAKQFLDFIAVPERAAKLVAGSGNPSGLTDVDSDLGSLQSSYDRVQSEGVPLVPYFDRVYMPNGMWSVMCTAVDSLITGQGDTASSVSSVKAEFDSLFGQTE